MCLIHVMLRRIFFDKRKFIHGVCNKQNKQNNPVWSMHRKCIIESEMCNFSKQTSKVYIYDSQYLLTLPWRYILSKTASKITSDQSCFLWQNVFISHARKMNSIEKEWQIFRHWFVYNILTDSYYQSEI